MSKVQRPSRVVMVDADNPMEEIHEEFVWLADHERALATARDAACRSGLPGRAGGQLRISRARHDAGPGFHLVRGLSSEGTFWNARFGAARPVGEIDDLAGFFAEGAALLSR